jgi:hypothetical protein
VTPATAVVSSDEWRFGDGTDALLTTANQAVHSFVNGAGPYTVSVTAVTTPTGQRTQGFTITNP